MAITEADIEMYAARIRTHFSPDLRETASVSSKDSLDKVEIVTAMEEDLGEAFVLPDELAARVDTTTFADLVRYVSAKELA